MQTFSAESLNRKAMNKMRLIDADNLGVGKANLDAFERKDYANAWNSALQAITKAAPNVNPETLPVVRQLREENEWLNRKIANLAENVKTAYEQRDKIKKEMDRMTAERDAAVQQLHGYCFACKHYTAYHNNGPCATCKHKKAGLKPWDAADRWEWSETKT